jgi:hypothetical protein
MDETERGVVGARAIGCTITVSHADRDTIYLASRAGVQPRPPSNDSVGDDDDDDDSDSNDTDNDSDYNNTVSVGGGGEVGSSRDGTPWANATDDDYNAVSVLSAGDGSPWSNATVVTGHVDASLVAAICSLASEVLPRSEVRKSVSELLTVSAQTGLPRSAVAAELHARGDTHAAALCLATNKDGEVDGYGYGNDGGNNDDDAAAAGVSSGDDDKENAAPAGLFAGVVPTLVQLQRRAESAGLVSRRPRFPIEDLHSDDLRELCKRHRLSFSGSKHVLLARLEAAGIKMAVAPLDPRSKAPQPLSRT